MHIYFILYVLFCYMMLILLVEFPHTKPSIVAEGLEADFLFVSANNVCLSSVLGIN